MGGRTKAWTDAREPRRMPNAGSPRRYLVTGGLGYAGAWVTSGLASHGHEVFVLSRGTDKPVLKPNPAPGSEKTPEAATEPPYTLIRADLTEQSPAEIAAALPDDLDGVVHAASFNEAFVPDYGSKALTANALGTRNLLESLVLRGEERSRPLPLLVYFSTFHVYGESYGHITEDSPPRPRGDYALTHLFGEEYCRMFGRTKGLPHIVIRPSNGYGAPKTAASTKWYLLLNDLCRTAFIEGRIVLRSDPAIPRDFVWLGDVAAVVEGLLGRPDLAGRIFNVSSGTALGLGEVARRAAAGAERFFGKNIPLILERKADPANDARTLVIDNSAVRSALNVAFYDRMDEEIANLFALLAGGKTADLP